YVVRAGQGHHDRTPSRGPEGRTRGSADRHRTRRGMVRRRRTGNASSVGAEVTVDAGHCPEPAPPDDRAALRAIPPSGPSRADPSRDARKPRGGRHLPRRRHDPGTGCRALEPRDGGGAEPVLVDGADTITSYL